MHTSATAESQELRLGPFTAMGISNQQADKDIEIATKLQIPGKNCKNNQQRRGRRRRLRVEAEAKRVIGAFSGIFWSINLAILICLAYSTNAVPTDSSNTNTNSNIASSTIVTVAVTPSSNSNSNSNGISSNSSSSSNSFSSSTESLLEQQQPQGQCLLDGLWVPETTAQCEKQTSCRAIQRTGHCCPDYKCDCEKDGKTYANGYKLVYPDTPCTVCYCKGGEIVCSSVTCFRRDDCMPKYVPGRCCPEYDNCPILDNNPPLSSETSSVAPATTKPAPIAPQAGFNWNITIKEITKPTEIRITDDNHKVKQAIPTRKIVSTEAPSTTAAAATESTTAATTAAAAVESTTTAVAAVVTTEGLAATDTPATPTPHSALSQDTNPKALPVNSSESLKLIASVGYIERPLQQQNSNKPLVTYNADGLQPLAENDPSKVNIKREYTTEGIPLAEAVPIGASSTFIQNGFQDALVDNAAELEPETAGSDNIYHIISTTEGPSSSSSTASSSSTTEQQLSSTYGYENSSTVEQLEVSTEGLGSSTSESPPASSSMPSSHHLEEDEVPQVESNPAYPSLPEDDFSLRDVNFPLVELEDIVEAETKDEMRSISSSAFERDNNKRQKLSTESSLDAGSGSGSGAGETMELYQGSGTEHMQAQASSQVTKVSIVQVPLMYSAEDSSSELGKIKRNQSVVETSAELETGSGSGSGELREPTTPRTKRYPALDIDELGSGGGSGAGGQAQGTAQDPKADAESLKLDESQEQEQGVLVKARAENSFVEQNADGAAAQHMERLYLKRIY